jgi:acyl-CoA dehydrogenase
MIDFSLSETDARILAELRREGLVSRTYARYYDEHEEELYPSSLPEASEFGKVGRMMKERGDLDTPLATFSMLMAIERSRCDGPPLETKGGGLGNAALRAAGTPEQLAKWEPLTISMAITEPGCGSDSKAIQMTAVLDGDEWVLNGEKIFVTTGIRCQAVVVWATLDKSAGRAGIKSFLVEKGTPGFETTHKEKKLGIRMSDTAAYVFRDCRIPRGNLLGGDESIPKQGSGGFKGVMKTFNMTRPGVAAGGIGKAQASFDFTREELAKTGFELDYEAGLHNRSAVQQKLIEIEADLEAARLAVLRAAALADTREPNNVEASVAKAKGGEIARTGTQRCLEILGGLGVTRDHLAEKWFRDSRITDIYEGTGQIQRLIIARAILGYSSDEMS